VGPAEVLSEGEQCALGIASFLAEIRTSGHTSAIVLDDPVCSLDQVYREKVAERLAKEAESRQVVVFTHDLCFVYELREAAKIHGVLLGGTWIQRRGTKPGFVSAEEPWGGLGINERIKKLKAKVTEAEKLWTGEQARYLAHVRDFYGNLRDAWEHLVERVVLQGVVTRWNRAVHTQMLRGVVVNNEVWERVRDGVGRGSSFVHDQPPAYERRPPTPSDMSGDLAALERFKEDYQKMNKAALEERPKPEV
jgi:hypothetical protein